MSNWLQGCHVGMQNLVVLLLLPSPEEMKIKAGGSPLLGALLSLNFPQGQLCHFPVTLFSFMFTRFFLVGWA